MKIRKRLAIAFCISSLAAGVLVYIFLRKPPVMLQKTISLFGLSQKVDQIRNSFENLLFPEWLLYWIPDMLWMFSLMMLILVIWDFRINKNSLSWIIISFMFGIGYELLQSIHWVDGYFDYFDLLFIVFGSALALIFVLPYKKSSVHLKER